MGREPCARTVSAIVAVLVVVPEVPVTVTVAVPTVAFGPGVNVSVLGAVEVAEGGLKDAVTPLGTPDALRETVPLKLEGATEMVLVTAGPACIRVTPLGEAERVNCWDCCELPDPPPQPIKDATRQTTTRDSSRSFSRIIDLLSSCITGTQFILIRKPSTAHEGRARTSSVLGNGSA
jgi:hypothetical protein